MHALFRAITAAAVAVAAMFGGVAAFGGVTAPVANAQGVEMLMVPSAAMGRSIPVAFQGADRTPLSCSTPSTPLPTSVTGSPRATP